MRVGAGVKANNAANVGVLVLVSLAKAFLAC